MCGNDAREQCAGVGVSAVRILFEADGFEFAGINVRADFVHPVLEARAGLGFHACGEGILAPGLSARNFSIRRRTSFSAWGWVSHFTNCSSGLERNGHQQLLQNPRMDYGSIL